MEDGLRIISDRFEEEEYALTISGAAPDSQNYASSCGLKKYEAILQQNGI
jgi:hypothetical protein